MLVIVDSFPQRVDESFDAAGEDPSQATEEFDSGQFASKGKPTFKTQPDVLPFYIFNIMYLLSCIYHSCITTFGWVLL